MAHHLGYAGYLAQRLYDNGHNGIMNTIEKQNGLEKYAGPGGWNDPDLLVTGCTELKHLAENLPHTIA
jgi:hypothetical protein